MGQQELYQAMLEMLEQAGVVEGIRHGQLLRLAGRPVFGIPLLAAKGSEPAPYGDGGVKFLVQPETETLPPPPEQSYRVDPERPDFTCLVERNQVLCTRQKVHADRAGRTIYGGRVPALDEERDWVEAGTGVGCSPDGETLFALEAGELFLRSGVLSVRPVLRLEQVDAGTGDIDYPGSVYIKGCVEGGRVKAEGSVVVGGVAERCTIQAGGHIAVGQGVKGDGDCLLEAGGSLRTPFLEHAAADIRQDIWADVLMSSQVTCGRLAHIMGPRGRIIGGTCTAREIEVKELGGPSETPTSVEILSCQQLEKKLAELNGAIAVWDKRSDELSRSIRNATNTVRQEVLTRLWEQVEKKREETVIQAQQLRRWARELRSTCKFEIRAYEAVYGGVNCTILGLSWDGATHGGPGRLRVMDAQVKLTPL